MIVVDASLFVAWLLNEPIRTPDEAIWEVLSARTALVPSHWPNEIANALRRAVRTRRLREDEIGSIAQQITTFDIDLAEPTSVGTIAELASDALHHELSAYDMIYVRLAHQRRLPLATVDQAMRAAAQRLGIEVLPA